MTVVVTSVLVEFIGNGVSTVFGDLPYPVKDGVAVYVGGVLDATATLSADKKQVQLTSAPAVGVKIAVARDTDIEQTADYNDLKTLPGETIESGLDRLTYIAQEHDSAFGRAMLAPPGVDPIEIPWGEDLTGKLLLGTSASALVPVDPSSLLAAIDPNLPVSAVPSFVLQTLKVLPPMLHGTVVNTSGYWTFGDGGHASYVWDAGSTAPDNGGTVIKITGLATGRYLMQHDDIVRIRQFGARDETQAGGLADQTPYMQAAHDALDAGIIWTDATPHGVGFIREKPLMCRRGRTWGGIANFSEHKMNDNFPDHGGLFEQDMTHEEGRFYQHGVHTTWVWLTGLVLNMKAKNGPCRARKIRRHMTYTDCSYLYIKGNPNEKQYSLTAYHTDMTLMVGSPAKPSANFNYHNHEINVVSDDCFAPSAYEMLGLNFPGLGRLANNNTITGGRIHGFVTAVHIEGFDNMVIDQLTNPPLGDANQPIHLDESDMRFKGLVGNTFDDANWNGHNVRYLFPRGRTNRLMGLWVERVDSRAAVWVDNANSSKLAGVMVDNCTAIEHPEQVIDTINPLGFRAGQFGGASNQIEILNAAGTSTDELVNFPKGARIVVHSYNPDRRDGISIKGHMHDGHSYTTIVESTFSGGKTVVTLADAVVDGWTCGAEREDVALRVDDKTLTINGNWEVQFAVGEQILYHKPNHGLASSRIVSRTHAAHPTDPAGFPAGLTTIVCEHDIVTEAGGIAFATFGYNRNPFRYANKMYEPEITMNVVNVRQMLYAAGFVNGSENGSEDCTIASGNINIASGNLEVLAQSGTADNLDKVTGLNEDGAIIHIRLGNPGVETITMRNNLGGSNAIYTNTGANVVLSAAHHEVMLRYNLLMARWVHIGGNTA